MSRKKGELAEARAEAMLARKGYTILQKNYWVRGAEIDIIAAEGDFIVFVEVKSLSSARFHVPRESVTLSKQRRICQAALQWMQENGKQIANVRFDVVEILPEGLSHLRGAFSFVE